MPSTQQQVIGTSSYDYLLFLPQNYETEKSPVPMILFLHGSGERGSNLEHVKRHGVAKIVEEQPNFPFLVISPQCPSHQNWSVHLLSALVDEALTSYRIDRERVYLTGLSMGGYGTWYLALEQPHRFAAIAPVCGGGNPKQAHKLKNLPVWVFHGARDKVVPLSESEEMVQALKKYGGNVKFTVYPEADHDCWTQTYNNLALYEWFLQHRRSSAA